MLNLNCIAAMNLDGGGSSQMAIGSNLVNRPEGGTFGRAVPTILAVVHPDSLPGHKEVKFEKIIDTEDSECHFFGNGWFATANAGYWGDSPSMLNSRGPGNARVTYTLNLQPARYELFAWWVAANNRCTNTPIIVHHSNGIDTIRVDQVKNGSQWNKIGQFHFSADTSNRVIISNAATQGTYVVADAIRLTSNDPALSAIYSTSGNFPVENPYLTQNYPNPFNASTQINFMLPRSERVGIYIFNAQGQKVRQLLDGEIPDGFHRIEFNAGELASGIYFCQIQTPTYTQVRKMMLLR
ncbi:T9SS type A sorting domain-containing protein [candidate division KSB1 bacterium]|nr:T9SS type A sorting domain-containing protein [candidate division KSB1 bacterium]